MPTPSDPPNRIALVDQSGHAASIWQRWFTQLYRAVVPTAGVFYIPSRSGAPTQTPETRGGFVPVVFDKTNGDLYIHDGTSWISVKLS